MVESSIGKNRKKTERDGGWTMATDGEMAEDVAREAKANEENHLECRAQCFNFILL